MTCASLKDLGSKKKFLAGPAEPRLLKQLFNSELGDRRRPVCEKHLPCPPLHQPHALAVMIASLFILCRRFAAPTIVPDYLLFDLRVFYTPGEKPDQVMLITCHSVISQSYDSLCLPKTHVSLTPASHYGLNTDGFVIVVGLLWKRGS